MKASPKTIQRSIEILTQEIIDYEASLGIHTNDEYLRELKHGHQRRRCTSDEWLDNARQRLKTMINLK